MMQIDGPDREGFPQVTADGPSPDGASFISILGQLLEAIANKQSVGVINQLRDKIQQEQPRLDGEILAGSDSLQSRLLTFALELMPLGLQTSPLIDSIPFRSVGPSTGTVYCDDFSLQETTRPPKHIPVIPLPLESSGN